MPPVSIGIPFYNAEETLPDALKSVFAQTFRDWELVLVDDGSTDASLEIARSVRDDRVRVVSDGRNLQLPARLNQIAEISAGEYIARMDADDLMHPDRLALQLEMLRADTDLDAVDSGAYDLDHADVPVAVRYVDELNPTAEEALRCTLLLHAAVVGKTRWFRDNPYDTSLARGQDYELWLRTVGKSRFGRVRRPLYFYRDVSCAPWQYLRRYVRYQATVRKIYRKYGPAIVGRPKAALLVALTFAKVAAYLGYTAFGKQHLLVQRRGRALTTREQAEATAIVEQVKRTSVPGLTS